MEITKARMDAEIRRVGLPYTTPMTQEYREVFIRGLKAAERICVQSRQDRVCPLVEIRAAIRRLEEK